MSDADFRELERKARAGDETARIALFAAEARLGRRDLLLATIDDVVERVSGLGDDMKILRSAYVAQSLWAITDAVRDEDGISYSMASLADSGKRLWHLAVCVGDLVTLGLGKEPRSSRKRNPSEAWPELGRWSKLGDGRLAASLRARLSDWADKLAEDRIRLDLRAAHGLAGTARETFAWCTGVKP